jgi:hypothetical protein
MTAELRALNAKFIHNFITNDVPSHGAILHKDFICLDPNGRRVGREEYGHLRIDHGNDEFANGSVHINGIEGFWGLAKVRLAKFKGVPKHTFHLHLKETEWRYNNRQANNYKTLLTLLRKNPLS